MLSVWSAILWFSLYWEGPVEREYVKGISTYLYEHTLSDLGEEMFSLVQPK
jgi:hypothetical protein